MPTRRKERAHSCDQSIDLIWGTLGSLFSKICFQFFLQTTRFFPFSPPNKKLSVYIFDFPILHCAIVPLLRSSLFWRKKEC